MPENDGFWNFYWEVALQPMENLGKREAVLAGSQLIRRIAQQTGRPVRVLEPGCGEGQIVGTLVSRHSQICDSKVVAGIDCNPRALTRCRSDFPGLQWVEGDFTDPALLSRLGEYDLVLLVNALHEVYSAVYSPELGQVDVPAAKCAVEDVLVEIIKRLAPGGWLLLFDGLEPPGDPAEPVQIRFLHEQARAHFEVFAAQYRPFRISYRETGSPNVVELSRRDFTRYIDKSIFLGKALWQTERLESYQYFREDEFRAAFAHCGLEISELRTLTVNAEKWRRTVEIVAPGVEFPEEHILIVARREQAPAGRPPRVLR
ncbi:MAG: class I SAM-dependent methyltransferase [Anaerolineaceae bacterium]|nr:class I SAM-dependent methyltransferase [Anaerolineaceae bacterium]